MVTPFPFDVSRETLDRFSRYEVFLQKWAASINLVSRETLSDVWRRHFLDSAQIYSFLKPQDRVIDLGSGAGFPGMVLAVMGCASVTLVEKDQKKVTFLKALARELSVSVHCLGRRFEDVMPEVYDVVVSRACAPLSVLLGYSKRFTGPQSYCILLKGRSWQSEVEDARKSFSFDCQDYKSLASDDGRILVIRNVEVHP